MPSSASCAAWSTVFIPGRARFTTSQGSAPAAGEAALQPLRVRVLELDAGAPGERVAERDHAPHARRLGHRPLAVAVAARVLRLHGAAVGVDGRVARRPRRAQAQQAHGGLGRRRRRRRRSRRAGGSRRRLEPPGTAHYRHSRGPRARKPRRVRPHSGPKGLRAMLPAASMTGGAHGRGMRSGAAPHGGASGFSAPPGSSAWRPPPEPRTRRPHPPPTSPSFPPTSWTSRA